MLVLSRRVGQSIHLGDDIIITVKSIDKDTVSLSFEAPDSLNIVRSEIRGKFSAEEIAARRELKKKAVEPAEEVKVGFVGQSLLNLTKGAKQ